MSKDRGTPLFLWNAGCVPWDKDSRFNHSGLFGSVVLCVNCGLLGLKWELKVLQ